MNAPQRRAIAEQGPGFALTGFNDWSALRFDGAGILGALTLPPRAPGDTSPPEFGEQAIAQVRAAQRAAAARPSADGSRFAPTPVAAPR